VATTIADWLEGIEHEGERLAYDAGELQSAAQEAIRGVPVERLPLRLAKRRIELLNACPRRAVAEAGAEFDTDNELFLIGRLVESAARMHLWNRYPLGDPSAVKAALAELYTARNEPLHELDDLAWDSITLRADRFARSWKHPKRGVDVHTGEQLVVPLAPDASGRPGVVLKGITDISIGAHVSSDPHRPRAILELKSGRTPWNPFNETSWYQFIVSAADGFAPHRVGVWAAAPDTDRPAGELVDTPVNHGSIATATRWVCDALLVVGDLAAGAKPEERPSGLCRSCPERIECPSAHAGLSLARADEPHDASFDIEDLDGDA
jgi:hypothetical protein